MGIAVKAAFSAGELDPVLWERTTLDKYKDGLATARNVVVTKNGSITSRPGRFNFKTCKLTNSATVCYAPPGGNCVLEWGHLYVRSYSLSGTLNFDIPHALTAADVPNMQFETSGSFVYVFVSGKSTIKLNYVTAFETPTNSMFAIPPMPVSTTITPHGGGTGYLIEYALTIVVNGEESAPLAGQQGSGGSLLPMVPGDSQVIDCTVSPLALPLPPFINITEVRVYRRPFEGGAYGYIGSTSFFGPSGGLLHATFTDLGQGADYTHSPPDSIMPLGADPSTLLSNTGVIYQQRLVIADAVTDLEAIYASRPGYQNDFYEDNPLNAASALQFKAGSSGYARVLRMLDSDGLVVFTTAGIFLNQGELDGSNLALAKKGQWVINPAIPALPVPGGTMFVDSSTNSVRNMIFNLYTNKYDAPEVSIYSQHLFRTRQINYWCFQQGAFPLLYVVFSDGTYSSFTFEFDQQMQAWTRHDSAPAIQVESVCQTIIADTTFFVVTKTVNGITTRNIEYTIPRYTLPNDLATNPEADKGPSIAYMDSIITSQSLLNLKLVGTDIFQLSPTTTTQDWSLPLNLTAGTGSVFGNLKFALGFIGQNIVGQVLRYFDSQGTAFDLKIITYVDVNTVIVDPGGLIFDSTVVAPRLYFTSTVFTGLSHMNGENVSVIVDGAVISSPNNDDQNYPIITVTNGQITLPNNLRGAIVHIGRPIIGDVETLDIDTVEQAPTLIESLNVNKLYIKIYKSSGMYCGNQFPVDTVVEEMTSLDSFDVDYSQDVPIVGNRYQAPRTKRLEVTLPGDWKSQGKICIRQVDPLHFEILSIIPDCEILQRSDR